VLRLTGRYYRTIPGDSPGYESEALELRAEHTALVALHCWNIGCEDGPEVDPNYWVGMGFPQTVREAARIMQQCIRPAMDAARQAGVLVCHVENEAIGKKHPEAQADLDPPSEPAETPLPAVPGWREKMVARFHGAECASRSPYAHMDRAKIVAPLPGEPFVYQTGQFDRVLRGRGIENLIYAGFAADMCVLRAPGGIEQMAPLGYRLFLLRDATLGCECPDTFEERIATRWAIRYFESHYGDTISLKDFLSVCRNRK